jgi:hypothetical protein
MNGRAAQRPEDQQRKNPFTWLIGGDDGTVTHHRLTARLRAIDRARLTSMLERRGRWFRRLASNGLKANTRPVFVVGSNRSGTQMVCEAIGLSPHGWDYQESQANLAFKDYQLRADWLVKTLIRLSPASVVSFGNILDSQFTDRLLDRFENSRALWVYRRYEDAANSSVRQWGNHFRDDMIRWVALGEPHRLGPRGQRIHEHTSQLMTALFHDDLTDVEGACLYWYMRNRLYFDLGLDRDPRVMLVQYEDTVQNPERSLRRICAFLGHPYHESTIGSIFATSVGKDPWQGVGRGVEAACDGLKQQLDDHYAGSLEASP